MVRKKIDNRLRTLIENGMATGHRSMFVVVGDKGRDQVPILHHMLSKAAVRARPSVLWCFKKELAFSSHRKKRMKQLQKKVRQGAVDADEDDPFELFVAATSIRYCYYKETHKILGRTYGMCVLQDFEALTPNLLARTVETVEGGGVIVLLLRSVDSLRQLFTMTMDVHARYRTEAHQDVVGRFNERFILSLASNKMCLLIDDRLNILPLSSHAKNITEAPPKSSEDGLTEEESKLKEIKEKLEGSQPTEALVNLCKTLDQAQALLQFIDALTDKKLDRTVSLTAARGRGKSAALGLAVAAAVGFGYSNIFVTSPSPENLSTLFDFVYKGFDAMEYEEHTDYDLVQSTNPEFNSAVVRINVHETRNGSHRQTIQYLHPADAHKLGQAELVVVDEAAAIPLPLVRELLGPYLVFMSSTINGYEGTGRSLSLKLLDQLRQQSVTANDNKAKTASASGRTLREVALDESIRYRPGDAVEDWLNRLLCLDADSVAPLLTGCPPPSECELYYVNRDTLFSYHKTCEAFLQRLVSLFVASHYKNSPNDLQMLSDAPAHHLFCLLGPTRENALPEVLCAIQVCLEGEISKQSIMTGLSRGKRASGDLIPWTMVQQYQDSNFPGLSGARVVRVATHPDYQRMGYGSRAIQLLQHYYEGQMQSLDERVAHANGKTSSSGIEPVEEDDVPLLEEEVRPRNSLPPLLLQLSERPPERLDYLGVSFGLTQQLFKFWKRLGFVPTYLRQTANDLTGEHSAIMLKVLSDDSGASSGGSWLPAFWADFRKRVVNLLASDCFRKFPSTLAVSLVGVDKKKSAELLEPLTLEDLRGEITPYDLSRLEMYCNNQADYHLIMDLQGALAKFFFLKRFGPDLDVSPTQKVILASLGLQKKSVDCLAKELQMESSQILGLFNRVMRKLTARLRAMHEEEVAREINAEKSKKKGKKGSSESLLPSLPVGVHMGEELEEAAEESAKKEKQREKDQEKGGKLGFDSLAQYHIKGSEAEWEKALKDGKKSKKLVSVKSGEKRAGEEEEQGDTPRAKKKKAKRKSSV